MSNNSNSDLLIGFDDDIEIVEDGEDVKVERRSEGTFRNGEAIEGNKLETFDARCSVQPESGNSVLQVAENDRSRRTLRIFSSFKFRKNDIMIREGDRYEIQIVHDWNVFTESLGVLKDV